MILRKILRVVEALPLSANDIYSVRSAHGTFANMLQVREIEREWRSREWGGRGGAQA